MFSFDRIIKTYDGNDEIEKTYSFFVFANNLTAPNIVKYMNDGTPVKYDMVSYNNDFLDIKTSISNIFYFSYEGNGYTENYSIYDGNFLIYENLNQKYSNNGNEEEGRVFTEIPKSAIENEKIEFKTAHYQTPGRRNWFDTYYFHNGNINNVNVLRKGFTLPKELQIPGWDNPKKITESEFLELVSNYDDEEDNTTLYEIVSDDNDEETLYYKILSYINDNLIVLDVDYASIGELSLYSRGSNLRGLFNGFQNGGRNRVKSYTNSGITFFSNSMFYNGNLPTTISHDNITMSVTYDGYSELRRFYPYSHALWNGGYLQNYITSYLLFSGFNQMGYENYNIPSYVEPGDFCVLWQSFSVSNL